MTVEEGTNTLVGTEPDRIIGAALAALAGKRREYRIPPLWDGRAAERVVQALLDHA